MSLFRAFVVSCRLILYFGLAIGIHVYLAKPHLLVISFACAESESINDIVYDITGVDVASFSKEFSQPDKCERSVSAMDGTLIEV